MNGARPVFLCANARTPIGRYGGGLASVRPDDLAAHVIREVLLRAPGLDPDAIGEVVFGCANQAGEDNRNVARMALLLAGLPQTTPGVTVNRLCASGLDAVAHAARSVALGEFEAAIAGGVESMTRSPFVMPKAGAAWTRQNEVYDTTIGWRFINPLMRDQFGVDSMPETGENVAAEFDVSREDQDAFALRSQQRAAKAADAGVFAEEIAPVSIPQRRGDPVIVFQDEHPRSDTTLDKLAKLPTPFRDGGSVTAGNASGVNGGAAALIVASEQGVRDFGLEPFARIAGFASAGVAPRVMGVGPEPTVRKLCQRLDVSPADFDVIELNEAFASQALAVMRGLGLPDDAEQVNPNGGAIALGHPLSMSGARLAMTAARELQRRDGEWALATMCVGVGQGAALAMVSC